MKKEYIEPEIEVIKFGVADIILTSTGTSNNLADYDDGVGNTEYEGDGAFGD